MPAARRLRGELDVPALERAFRELVRRHEVLRTVFPATLGRPHQSILSAEAFLMARIDLTALPGRVRKAEARRRLGSEARRPFDLTREPPLRVVVVRLAERDHVLFTNPYHIASDGWSRGIFHRELKRLYQAAIDGEDLRGALPPLPVQYADFAVWQRRRLRGEVLEAQLSYWRERLAGIRPLELPTDRSRPAVRTSRGAVCSFTLSREQTQALKRLSLDVGTSLFMTLLTAFQILAQRLSGQNDLAVGSPIANRHHQAVEPLIGFFVNTLVLRGDLSGALTLRDALVRTRRTCLEAYAYQDLPFEKLVEELEPERDLSRSPLFQVMVGMQNAPADEPRFGSLELSVFPLQVTAAHFDLTLTFGEDKDRLSAGLRYNTDLFRRTTMLRWTRNLEAVLVNIGQIPLERPVFELSILNRQERHQVFAEWNDTLSPRAAPRSVVSWFEEQVAATPEATAVTFCQSEEPAIAQRWLTYRELDARATRLARTLAGLGVGRDSRVALCLERSLEMLISLLGILKSGAAYVALDPSYPEQRLAFMFEETCVSNPRETVLLTRSPLPGALREIAVRHRVNVVNPGRARSMAGSEMRPRPPAGPAPSSLVYVVYTSGSTGRPKGIAMPHLALRNLIEWHLSSLLRRARTLQYASVSFDASFHELFAAWCSGGCIFMVSEELRRDLGALSRLLVSRQLEKLKLPVVVLHRLAEESLEHALDLDTVRELAIAGEQLIITPPVEQFFRRFPRIAFHNHYGPSEAQVVTGTPLHGDPSSWPSHPSIGRPISNTEIYLLDRGFGRVPIGCLGELHIGGISLARGYLDRPALTAEKFVPDPFATRSPGSRLYRTGDLARWLADGRLDFQGRIDFQVKIRGFRVELKEIEAVLTRHPGIREAVVIVGSPGDGGSSAQRWLAGFVVPERGQGSEPTARVLCAFLAERLPDHMVPRRFAFLSALPLSPTGKVDRKALGSMRLEAPDQAGSTPPRTPSEEILATIWRHVLGIAAVGVDDNFFELGGHSLLATQVASRVRKTYEVELPLKLIFAQPTIAELARQIDVSRRASASPALPPPIEPAGRAGELPLSFAQQRLWFLQQLEPQSSTYNMGGAQWLRGELDVPALERAFRALVRRHEVLRTVFPATLGRPHQSILSAEAFRMAQIDLTALPEKVRETEARRHLEGAARRPFDLTREPPLRVFLARLAKRDHVLFINPHHIASDGWSQGIFRRELRSLYEAALGGEDLRQVLPPLPIQYADFAVWQRAWLQGETLDAQLSYWRGQLAGIRPLELPTDFPRPAAQTYRGEGCTFIVSPGMTRALKRLSLKAGTSLFMTLLTTFQIFIQRLSGQRDFAIGSPIANRHFQEIEPLIGFFVNTLVLRSDVSESLSFQTALARSRRRCLEAYAHQDVPFEKLVEVLDPERDLSRSTLFQVMLVLQNAPTAERRFGDLETTAFPLRARSEAFDLSLVFRESADRLYAHLSYSTDLFHRTTILRWARELETLLKGIGRITRDQPVSELSMFSRRERHQLLCEWNDTRQSRRRLENVAQWIDEQVERTPDAVAVVGGDHALSFAGMRRRALRISLRLRALGAGPETLVGLMIPRSIEMVVALLAVIETGAAWVALDPELPDARLKRQVDDLQRAGPQVGAKPLVVTRRDQLDRSCLEGDSVRRLLLDAPGSGATGFRRGFASPARPLQVAFLTYTSGSTGRPKGVACTHEGLLNRLRSWQENYPLDGDDAVLHKTALSFDVSVGEILWPLVSGARLVITPPEVHRDLFFLLELIRRQRVTTVEFVPSVLHVLLEVSSFALPLSLRQVMSGGEALTPALQVRLQAALSDRARLHNTYGPAEATIDATWWPCVPRDSTIVPIGRPITQLAAFVLDRSMYLQPLGVAGELHLGGPQLARGYWSMPARTAQSFVPHPFAHEPGERLYKTGDLCCWTFDGQLDFVGRCDHQVKIRGHRIEIGEVEAALAAHPRVGQAAVVATRLAHQQELSLICYVTPASSGHLPRAEELRSFLARSLPQTMLPAYVNVLERIPLTASGKVDRAALRQARSANAVEGHVDPSMEDRLPFIAPRDPIEAELAEIWAALLGIDRVGTRDDFFALGGHSLLAVRLMAHIGKRFGIVLPLAEIFRRPTLEELACCLEAERQDLSRPVDAAPRRAAPASSSSLVVIQQGGEGPAARAPFFCVHPVGGHVLCYAELARHLGLEQPFYGLQVRGHDGREPLHRSLEEMAAFYVDAIQEVMPHGPYHLGGWSMGGVVAWDMARRLSESGEDVALLVLIDAPAPAARRPKPRATPASPAESMASLRAFARHLRLNESLPSTAGNPAAELILNEILIRARRAGVLDESCDLERLSLLYRLFRNNAELMRRFVPDFAAPRPAIEHTVLFRAGEAGHADGDPPHGWGAWFDDGLEVVRIAGDHFTILQAAGAEMLAEHLGGRFSRDPSSD